MCRQLGLGTGDVVEVTVVVQECCAGVDCGGVDGDISDPSKAAFDRFSVMQPRGVQRPP